MRRFRMKALPVIALSAVALFAAFLSVGQTAQAAEDEEYTYTVKLFAGNQGEITKGGVTASRNGKASPAGVTISYDKDKATVKGLKYGDTVYINYQDAAVVTDERYYVKGVRRSGRDNSEATESTFSVGSDRDYVIAYGIKGDMVSYTVNYVDEDGTELLDSDTYYGLPGEQQHVSARYVDGYQPQSYNLVKTLVQNEAENVFEFVYAPITEPTPTPAPTPTPTTPATTTPATTTPAATPAAPAAATPATPAAATPTPPATTTPEGEDTEPVGGDQTTIPDEQTPQGTTNLDDENTPLGQQDLEADRPGTVVSYLPLYIGIGAAAAAALAIMGTYVYLKKKKKKAMAAMSAQQIIEEASDMHDGNK